MHQLRVILPILLLLVAAGCGGEAEEVVEDPVEVLDFRYVMLPGGARVVTGKLHNRTTETISSAQIQIALYDQDNRFVTTMSVVVRDIDPDEHKPFRQGGRCRRHRQGCSRAWGVCVVRIWKADPGLVSGI